MKESNKYTFIFFMILIMNTQAYRYVDNFQYPICASVCRTLMGRPYTSKFNSPKQQAFNLTLELLNSNNTKDTILAKHFSNYKYDTKLNHYLQQKGYKVIQDYHDKYVKKYTVVTEQVGRSRYISSSVYDEEKRGQYIEIDYAMYPSMPPYFDTELAQEVLHQSQQEQRRIRPLIDLPYPQIPIDEAQDISPMIPYAGDHVQTYTARIFQYDIIEHQVYSVEQYFKRLLDKSAKLTEDNAVPIMSLRDFSSYLRFGYYPAATAQELQAFNTILLTARFGNEYLSAWQSCTTGKGKSC